MLNDIVHRVADAVRHYPVAGLINNKIVSVNDCWCKKVSVVLSLAPSRTVVLNLLKNPWLWRNQILPHINRAKGIDICKTT